MKAGRAVCESCARPARVCLCPALPRQLLCTLGYVLVLQHPHEARRSLSTTPLLAKVLSHTSISVGRKFTLDESSATGGRKFSPELKAACDAVDAGRAPIFLLYPGEDAVDVAPFREIWTPGRDATARHAFEPGAGAQEGAGGGAVLGGEGVEFVLLVVDGTWRQAGEMLKALPSDLLERVVRVRLEEGCEARQVLKKQPVAGGVTTLEAVARAMAALCDDAAVGAAIEAPLQRLTALQGRWDPAIQMRQRRLRQAGAGSAPEGPREVGAAAHLSAVEGAGSDAADAADGGGGGGGAT